ncbi:MAG TPA: 2-amino-4-hydroxy-6-hydroxymethyldihydropteridine diphosphokinase [Kofleriaceae bacterium]|nr:2-amino-4-hydroxy-6-hydroxymethyldihydropteridine diphosphokinase [Kofleriaceae bacterium]
MDSVVVGFGGNIGDDAAIVERFQRAREAFAVIGSVRSASLYRSAPIGPAQPAFLNTAVAWRFDGGPAELISTVLEIERLLGRVRVDESRWGPRVIDLDVLVWGDRMIRTPELEVPHPRLVERRFALLPLIDLLGEDAVVAGQPLAAHARRVASQVVEPISETW